ncbi:hypothetical protein GBF38_016016 [Nibea albiflora]|uniref:Uncharacterized protein n=1 Tax=Nibea albiflora TaxID=240163 RepID=A0ACB7FHS9_NIBAL|nr:hypothetical protein GBF38_016016 [Nibea albiflora]
MYKAVIAAEEDKTVAEYEVTVQDPVSAVNLTVNCSSALNFTVTCSTVDSHISSTFRCDNKTCSRESSTTTDPSSIDVYLDQGFIFCNHSNHVSWEHKKEEIKSVCEPPPGSECVSAGISVCLVKTVVFSVGLIIMVSAVITVHIMEKLKRKKL